jgi:hypothetical protein
MIPLPRIGFMPQFGVKTAKADGQRARERFRASRMFCFVLCVLIALGIAFILYRRDPAIPGFYPPCPFHWLTGLHCPGCGSLRCLHALLHGQLVQALAWNPLTVCCLPFLLIWTPSETKRLLTGTPLIRKRTPGWVVMTLFWMVVVFWILRNLPFWPCTLLAPHALSSSL